MHTQPGDATRSRTLCTCVSWLDLGRDALCVALWHISGCGRRCCATGSIHSILFYYNIAFSACRTANENACSLLLCYLSFRLFGLCVMNAESIRLYGNQQPSIHSCHHFDLKPANNTPFEQSITLAVNGVAQLLLCFFASLTTYILFCSRLLRSFGYIVVRFQCFGCCSVSTIAEWGGKVLYSVTVGLRLPAMSFHYDCTAKLSDNVEQKQEPKQKWKKKRHQTSENTSRSKVRLIQFWALAAKLPTHVTWVHNEARSHTRYCYYYIMKHQIPVAYSKLIFSLVPIRTAPLLMSVKSFTLLLQHLKCTHHRDVVDGTFAPVIRCADTRARALITHHIFQVIQ